MNLQQIMKEILEWIQGAGPLAPAFFVLIYILATVAFFPGIILTMGAGILFGVLWGSVLVSIAATLGAAAAFLTGRYLARKMIAKKMEKNVQFKAVDEAVGREGWKIVLLTRLSPVFPFNLLNYAFGLTKVAFKDYFFASWAGMLPGTVLYVYIGALIGDIASLGSGRTRTPMEWALYGVGFAATIAVTLYITRIARKALKQKIG